MDVYAFLEQQMEGHVNRKTLREKATIHQVTTMLATSKNVLFLGHNHLLTTGTDDLTLCLSYERQRVKGHQYRWLAGAQKDILLS